MYFMAGHYIHYDLVHPTTDNSAMVVNATCVRRNDDSVERLLCNYSKCILHERNGMASCEDSSVGADGSGWSC